MSDTVPDWAKHAPGTLVAVLDAAHGPEVMELLKQQAWPNLCLYAEPAATTMAAYAPYLIPLDAPRLSTLLQRVAGRPWASFFAFGSAPDQAVRQLKRFLWLRGPDGKRRYFRFYDPRVLRLYLQTCTREQLQAFFGRHLQAAYVQAADAGSMLEFRPPARLALGPPSPPARVWPAAAERGGASHG